MPSGDTGTGGVDDQPTSCADIDCSQPRPEGMVTFDLIAHQKLYDSCCAEQEGECTNGASNYPACTDCPDGTFVDGEEVQCGDSTVVTTEGGEKVLVKQTVI